MSNKIFETDPERLAHLDLLADAFYENLERGECEYGGWGLDDKRPFGNSYVCGDLAEIVGIEIPPYEDKNSYNEVCQYLNELYSDLGSYLKFKWEQGKQSVK